MATDCASFTTHAHEREGNNMVHPRLRFRTTRGQPTHPAANQRSDSRRNSAITYLYEIESPVVICVLDRSVAEESAAEGVVQLRNTRGEPVSLTDDIRWRPPEGVEAFGFTVPL